MGGGLGMRWAMVRGWVAASRRVQLVAEQPLAGLVRWAGLTSLLLTVLVGCGGGGSNTGKAEPAEPVRVAVAANFADAQEEIARAFTASTGQRVETSLGSTGQLYAEIRNGAPFDVLLAADTLRPRLLEDEGLARAGTRFTYAEGRLVLYGPGREVAEARVAVLRGSFQHLAIADSAVAPYGVAAMVALRRLGVSSTVSPRLVRGQSVGQAFQFVESGAAELGLVALSQVRRVPRGQYWVLPTDLYPPIRQDAVLLKPGAERAGARAYLRFLQGGQALDIMSSYGYSRARRAAEGAGTDLNRGGRRGRGDDRSHGGGR